MLTGLGPGCWTGRDMKRVPLGDLDDVSEASERNKPELKKWRRPTGMPLRSIPAGEPRRQYTGQA